MAETITCYCGEVLETSFDSVYDGSSDSTLVPSILDGSFMSTTCDKCGKVLKPELVCTIKLDDETGPIVLIPELERNRYLSGAMEPFDAWRVVIGFPELEEKVRIALDHLNDSVIEMVKLRLLENAEETDVHMFYRGIEDGNIVMHIHGLKDGEIGISRIPMTAYEAMERNLPSFTDDEEYGVIVEPPYVSINKVYFEE